MIPASAIENLSIGYGSKVVAHNLNLQLRRGEVTALLGRNGIGKSTLIKTITGNIPPLTGSVKVEGIALATYRRHQLARLISIVSTSDALTGGLRLSEYVGLGRTPYTGITGTLSGEDKIRVEEAINLVGISHKQDNFFAHLSDGERQKGMIARALAQDTPIIIMDEPFSFLDVAARIEILQILKDISRKEDKAILFSTHEVTQALRMTDRVWLFYPDKEGEVATIASGSPTEIIASGLMQRLFDNPKIKFDEKTLDFKSI